MRCKTNPRPETTAFLLLLGQAIILAGLAMTDRTAELSVQMMAEL